MILRVDHIGIAVNDVREAAKLYTEALGLELEDIEVVTQHNVRVAIIPIGENRIELLEPTSPDSPISKFLNRRGEGLHHLSLQVDDIEKALDELKKKGVPLIDQQPGIGAHQTRVAFLDPKATKILLELTEKK